MNTESTFKFDRQLSSVNHLKKKPLPGETIPFGRIRTDHMFDIEYCADKGGWQTGTIKPIHEFTFPADAVVFHYGQQVFEGLKAYRSVRDDKKILLFRPDLNAARFVKSAELLGMHPVPEALFLDSIKAIVDAERDWILPSPNALYIRPMLIPLDDGVYARASANYRYSVLVSPVQEYFTNSKGVTLAVERVRTRACPGGVGEAKCGGNYAASMASLNAAKKLGADQTLFLDGAQHRYVEEASAMNIFFIYGTKLVTPELSGSILRGVTRNSIIALAKAKGLVISEERVEMDQIIADVKSEKLTECFLCGTAAVISPVRAFIDQGKELVISSAKGQEIASSLRKELVDIQTGVKDGPAGWIDYV